MKPVYKTLLLGIYFFIAAYSAKAQKVHITDTANSWVTNGYAAECTFTGIASYKADTVISGEHYLPLSYTTTHVGSGCTWMATSMGQGYFIREDSVANMVYYRSPVMDTLEHVLYNYNLHVGDTIQYHYYTGSPMTITDSVIAIDSVLINGTYHKTFDFRAKGSSWGRSYTVIEGVGGTNNPIFPAFFTICFEYGEYLSCYRHGTTAPAFNMRRSMCVYNTGPLYANCSTSQINTTNKSTPSPTITPNPASTELHIATAEGAANISVYDLTGRCIYHAEASGQNTTINTSLWHNGLYMVVVRDGAGMMKKEMVVVAQ